MKKTILCCLSLLTAITASATYYETTVNSTDCGRVVIKYENAKDEGPQDFTCKIVKLDDSNYNTTLNFPDAFKIGSTDYTIIAIEQNAFNGKSLVTEITIPTNVTSIGAQAFYDMSALTKVTWNAKKVTFADANPPFLGSYPTTVVIGSEVEEIPARLFENKTDLTTLTFKGIANLKSIGAAAFQGIGVKRLNLRGADGLEIADNAFLNCQSLEEIEVREFGDAQGVVRIGDKAFKNCKKLRTINFGFSNAIKSIGEEAFYGDAIDFVVFANGVIIGQKAFSNMTASSFEVNIVGSELPQLGYAGVFASSNLSKVTIPCDLADTYAADNYWPEVMAQPTTILSIDDDKKLTPEMLKVNNADAKAAGCNVNIVSEPTCDNQAWTVKAEAPEDSEWQFIGWRFGAGCTPEIQVPVEDVADDPYFELEAQFAKESQFNYAVKATTNVEMLGGIVATVCDAELPRTCMKYFAGEDATFEAIEDTKGWVTFKEWKYDDQQPDMTMINTNGNKISFTIDVVEIDNTLRYPSEITAVYEYANVEATVVLGKVGDGTIEGSISNPVKLGGKITLTAKPEAGKYFKGWKLGGVFINSNKFISTDATLDITLQAAHLYAATLTNEQNWIISDGELMELSMAQTQGDHFEAEYVAVFSDTPSGIETPIEVKKVQKMLENGQVYILMNGKRYNLLGALVGE